MAEPPPTAPPLKGSFENFVNLIDVITDWSFVVLVVLIIFYKQIGAHVSGLVKELTKLVSRLQSAKVGGTSWVFSPSDLKSLAAGSNAELLRNILLHMPDSAESTEIDDAEAAEVAESEANEIEALLTQYKSRQDRENDA